MADAPNYQLSDALVESLDNGFDPLRDRLADLGDDEYLWEPAPEVWGPYAHHARLHLAFHAERELIHHAAEIMLLRDLYRATR